MIYLCCYPSVAILKSVSIFRVNMIIAASFAKLVILLHPCCTEIQSTLVISNSKGLSEILRDIRTSTYQICRIEEKI